MPVKQLPKYGTLSLFQASEPITEFGTPELYALIEDMRDTMIAANGIGIAAPQIGVNKRVIMLGYDHNPRYPNMKPLPFMILINPEIEILDDTQIFMWEGCLSVPGLRGKVPRYKKVKYKGWDPEGNPLEGILEDFHARVMQHEVDHINGKLYPLHIIDMHDFGFEEVVLERAIEENQMVILSK